MRKRKEIFLIPYAHLDTQWRWEFPTTINKYIKKTLDENIYLFEKYPEYCFNFTGALRYAMMKEYYPEKFEKVKKYIAEGRWNYVGTCLDETDALIPSVESMIRNILYGDRWAKRELCTRSRDYVIPDCFGFPANMPTILSYCGLHGFSSQKLTWGSAVGIPFEIGIWEGPDGNGIVSALNPGAYVSRIRRPVQKSKKRLRRLNALGEKTGIWKSYQYYGVGDIGGAPKESSVKKAIMSMKKSEEEIFEIIVRQGSSDQFFSEITEKEKELMERYSGDLLLVNHSAGTLTSAAIMKRWNRKNELLAYAAEVSAVTALLISGLPYPKEKIKSAWFKIIQNQMHDILPGTSTPIAYEYSQNDEILASNILNSVLEDSASAIASYVKGEGSILLFNPLGEYRNDAVDIKLANWHEDEGSQITIMNAEGNILPAQIQKNYKGDFQITFIPELKPCSWSRFSIQTNSLTKDIQIKDVVSIISYEKLFILENSNYRVRILKDGKIESIFHKRLDKELLKKPLAYEFQKEKPSLFPAWNMDWKDRKKDPFLRLESGATVSIIENGPIRCTIQITTTYNTSKFVKEISLVHNSEIVEFTERINWRETGCSIKLALNVNMNRPEVIYNWETSRIIRGLNNEKLFEMPSRYWVDMSEDDWGISIIEDSKYGYDHPHDDTLRMTLLYTPGIHKITGFWDQKFQDWGEHTIRYAIYGHKGNFKGTDHLAKRFNQKVHSFSISNDLTSEAKNNISLFEVSSKQLGILAVKQPEDSEGILIRVYERYGTDLSADIIFKSAIHSVKEVNGIEEYLCDISHSENKFRIKIDANGIRSYIVELKDTPKPYSVKQKILKLEYNSKLIGSRKNNQIIFSRNITPAKILSGSVSYELARDQYLNALQCRAQTIPIPEGFNTLSILVGSIQECSNTFKWVDGNGKQLNEETHLIPSINNFLGQWDKRIWKKKPKRHLKEKRDYFWINKCIGVEPGYITRARLEWFATHTYKAGKIQAYRFGYLYTIKLNIPKDAKSLILPDDFRIYIMAMTASQQKVNIQNNQILNDKFDF
ncbi:MAG: alpha-mannosidase [Promethearchaeota archaeon]